MALAAGDRLGPYEVLHSLGAGGMGEVYRARDTRLGRTVALKILPPDFSADPQSRRRFEQEARAVSALNHPHICALYDVGSEAGIDFLVMEFLEGQSLAERLTKGPLPLAEALDHAIHVADALGRAHGSGIVHRDVKPGNIMLTKDGAKLLDFGLARIRVGGAASAATVSRTVSAAPLTQEGLVAGTVPYMSPEQLEGRETDARTDIFSFGAVLYEMLSGHRPFDGDSQASVIAQIMTADPRPLVDVQPITPVSLERTVRLCLAKDAEKRWQSASDIARQLEGIAEQLRSPGSGARPVVATVPRWWQPRGVRRLLAVAALVAVAAAVAGAFAVGERIGTPVQPAFHRVTFRRGTVDTARFTPDGLSVVYAARWDGNPRQVFTVRTDGVDSEEREVLKGLNIASISSRNELAVLRGASLAIAPFSGGSPRPHAPGVTSADWSPDGSRLAVTRARAVEYPIGTVIFRAEYPDVTVSDVRVSPRGDLVAFREHTNSHGVVIIVDAGGRKRTQSSFVDGLQPPVWHPAGKEVWFSAAMPDARDAVRALDLRGRERSILRDPAMTIRDITRDGRVLLSSDYAAYSIYGRGPGDAMERDLTYYGWSLLDDLSADGRMILFTEGGESDAGNGWNVFTRSMDGSPPQRLSVRGCCVYGKLSPDQKWVASLRAEHEGTGLSLLPTGAGDERVIGPIEHLGISVAGWLPDSATVLYNRGDQIWAVRLDGEPRALSPEGWVAAEGLVSPDGHFGCMNSDPQDPWMYLCALGTPMSKALPRLFDSSKWAAVGWTADGRHLRVYHPGTATPRQVFLLDVASGDVTPWKEFGAQVDRAGLQISGGMRMRFSADGEAYAYTLARRLSTLYVVHGLR